MRLFLDTSVLLAACGSSKGASRFLVNESAVQGWELLSSHWCKEEARKNIVKFGPAAMLAWPRLVKPRVRFVTDDVSLDCPFVFPKAKDRPVLITALAAKADWLLTLDTGDFHRKLGGEACGLRLGTPAEFLMESRAAGCRAEIKN